MYATKIAITSRTNVVTAELISLRMTWKIVAEIITIMIPAAAHCVHQG
jgi:hypothetical protein